LTRYTWESISPIQTLDIIGGKEAIIYAPANQNVPGLGRLPQFLKASGLTVLQDQIEGKPALRVTGFSRDRDILDSLEKNRYLVGTVRQQLSPDEQNKPPQTFMDKLTEKSLTYSGYAYLLADLILMGSGIHRKEFNELQTGIAWGLSDVVLSIYGEEGVKGKEKKILKDLKKYLQKEGVEIPQGDDITAENLTKKGGLLETVDDFLRLHVTDIKAIGEIYGGATYTMAGFSQGNDYKKVAGICVLAAWIIALLVPEKTIENRPDYEGAYEENVTGKPRNGGGVQQLPSDKSALGWMYDKLQERPFMATGTLAIANNVLTYIGAVKERDKIGKAIEDLEQITKPEALEKLGKVTKGLDDVERQIKAFGEANAKNADALDEVAKALNKPLKDYKDAVEGIRDLHRRKHAHIWNYASGGVFFVANVLFGISKKSRDFGQDMEKIEYELALSAANMLSDVPEETRKKAVDAFANYLSTQPDMPHTSTEIAMMIDEKIEALNKTPWASKIQPGKPQSQAVMPLSSTGSHKAANQNNWMQAAIQQTIV
jgi:tetratricopeptide (TPR) repeat protein